MKQPTKLWRMSLKNKDVALLVFGVCVALSAWTNGVRAEIYDHTGGALNGYQLVYELDIQPRANYTNGVPYTTNNSASVSNLVERVGYYMVLDDQWVFTSMDAFSNNASALGVPNVTSGMIYQGYVNNLYYKSNVASLGATDGMSVSQGNIEFWPTNYNATNGAGIPNASGSTYDFGDSRDAGGNYGSMQVHDYQSGKTVFAYNSWNGGTGDLGIGNQATGHPDWTFASNAGNYTNRQLGVYVQTLNFDAVASDSPQRGVIEAETANMAILYKYNVDTTNSGARTTTLIDNTSNSTSALVGMPLARTAYYYELTDADGNKTYAYTSFDALTHNQSKTGLPGQSNGSSTFTWQTGVSNMTVQSNVAGVVNGTGIETGNVEIWGCNYTQTNNVGVSGASDSIYDFGDQPTNGSYGSFQVHNHGAQQTVFALNHWASNNSACVGIGNNPNASSNSSGGQKDWTFCDNAGAYSDVKLYVLAEAAIAPGMASVADGNDYSIVQGAKITSQMNTNWHNGGLKYDIVDNLESMQTSGKLFDRVGYYIEYSATGDDLYYAFVSMDAFTNDLSKIGVPVEGSNIAWQQTVKNLEVSTNVPASEGILTSGSFKSGYLEFWPSNYGPGKGNVISQGSGAIYDINDSDWGMSAGHGSMQVHNLDTGETVFALNHLNGTKQYGIGTNPNAAATNNTSQADWTFDEGKSGYKIANIYTMVRESEAVLTTLDAASGVDFYQRNRTTGVASVDISGTFQSVDSVSIDKIQASADGTNWVDLTMDAAGGYSGAIDLAGGWHYVNVRALDGSGNVLTSTTTGKIGVGEIFITAGQSNSTNYGDVATASTTGNVVALNHTTGEWGYANDPQPVTINGSGDGSSRGSTWPAFGDTLSEMAGVPIGIVSVGWGGSSIQQWNPDNVDTSVDGWDAVAFSAGESTLFGRLAYAIEELDGEFAGVLWHQGESNAGSTEDFYYNALKSLIEASREEAGWDVPWGVALVSWRPEGGSRDEGLISDAIRAAQLGVTEDMEGVFLGPDSDALLGLFRGTDGNSIHFSEEGLRYLGELWALTAGKDILGLPEPGTYAMMILGVVGLFFVVRRGRSVRRAGA
ncbi:MAG: sialate O-acetylesterase [Planctomycetia bacterium]|nr:sialate O-acetylesterase [Planctomycetia bacterium]